VVLEANKKEVKLREVKLQAKLEAKLAVKLVVKLVANKILKELVKELPNLPLLELNQKVVLNLNLHQS
jgi:hypothetical protein